MAGRQKSKIIWFSRKVELSSGVFIYRGNIVSKEEDGMHVICRADEVRIPGTHNLENALAAAALARCYSIPEEVIRKTLMEFPGVEHRIEFVREAEGIWYINDSKGTNPDSTEKAAAAMTRPTVIILGGSSKKNSFVSMIKSFGENIKALVAIGETREDILRDAKTAEFRMPVLLVLFVGSGCAALIYEVVWFQLLQQVIGSSAVSLGVLLGTYMGGLCLGSLFLPRVVAARHHPLRVYGLSSVALKNAVLTKTGSDPFTAAIRVQEDAGCLGCIAVSCENCSLNGSVEPAGKVCRSGSDVTSGTRYVIATNDACIDFK
jgi:hypothetical protein